MEPADDPGPHAACAVRDEGFLDVGDGHSLYWQEAGNTDGLPLLILHGGPGGTIKEYYRKLADPENWRIILFEQRGCGRSLPRGGVQSNTLDHLVADMETLRRDRQVERWTILGGSWGSTLALAYALAHPFSCTSLVLTGVFLARAEVDAWWTGQGARFIQPEAWQALMDFLEPAEKAAPLQAYARRMVDEDFKVALAASAVFLGYEGALLDPWPREDSATRIKAHHPDEDKALWQAGRIFGHYMGNGWFLDEQPLLPRMETLRNIPGYILAGRLDFCTPPSSAFDLQRCWQGSRLEVVDKAGHRWDDPYLAPAIRARLSALASDIRRI